VGGHYRIENELADGSVVVLCGEYLVVKPPRELVYTWRVEHAPAAAVPELVTVRFEPRETGTEVVVLHERIDERALVEGHQAGWRSCLFGLARYLAAGADQ
jgi:uncharacterized protein YndB with AHSA1/START domain